MKYVSSENKIQPKYLVILNVYYLDHNSIYSTQETSNSIFPTFTSEYNPPLEMAVDKIKKHLLKHAHASCRQIYSPWLSVCLLVSIFVRN